MAPPMVIWVLSGDLAMSTASTQDRHEPMTSFSRSYYHGSISLGFRDIDDVSF